MFNLVFTRIFFVICSPVYPIINHKGKLNIKHRTNTIILLRSFQWNPYIRSNSYDLTLISVQLLKTRFEQSSVHIWLATNSNYSNCRETFHSIKTRDYHKCLLVCVFYTSMNASTPSCLEKYYGIKVES